MGIGEDYYHIALHEAAHAIVADRLGQRPSLIDVTTESVSDGLVVKGRTSIPALPEPDSNGRWKRAYSLDLIAILLAGTQGERLSPFPASDPLTVDGITRRDAMDTDGAALWLDRLFPTPSLRQRKLILDRERCRALSLLGKDLSTLLRLGAVLSKNILQRVQMDGELRPFSLVIEGDELATLLSNDGEVSNRLQE